MGFVASVCQPSTLRMLIWPEASSAQNNIAAVSADGSTVCVLILRLNSSCNRSIEFMVRALRHWLGGRRVKVKSRAPARDLDRPERSCQRPRLAAVAVARNAGSFLAAGHPASSVAWAHQHGVQLAADQFFEELSRPSPYLGFDRIKPVVEKINSHLGCRPQRIRLRANVRHVSSLALQRRMIRG